MGNKKTNKYYLIKNGVMTGTTTVTSSPQNVENFDNVGLEIVWTGTPTGTITIQGSISQSIPGAVAVSYTDLTFAPLLDQPAGSAGRYLVNVATYAMPFIRVNYVNTSGSGTLNVYLYSKDVN